MTKLSRWWAVFLLIATVELLLLIKLLNSGSSIELLLTIGIVAALLVLILRIEDLSNLSVTRDGISAQLSQLQSDVKGVDKKVDQVEGNISQLENDINALLISTVLDAFEYITLLKVKGEEVNDKYEFNYPKGQDLLERLRNRGLVKEIGGNSIFNDRKDRTIKLRDHFSITERGERYLQALTQNKLDRDLRTIAERSGYKE